VRGGEFLYAPQMKRGKCLLKIAKLTARIHVLIVRVALQQTTSIEDMSKVTKVGLGQQTWNNTRNANVAMINLDNICEYFIWWPDKDKDPNIQVCPNWAPSGRWIFDDEDDANNKIFIRLCPEHLTEICCRSKPMPADWCQYK